MSLYIDTRTRDLNRELTSSEVQRLRAKGVYVSIPFFGMPRMTPLYWRALNDIVVPDPKPGWSLGGRESTYLFKGKVLPTSSIRTTKGGALPTRSSSTKRFDVKLWNDIVERLKLKLTDVKKGTENYDKAMAMYRAKTR